MIPLVSSQPKLLFIFSDNASNMVKAFDLLDNGLYTYTIPDTDDHKELEDLDTDFKDLVKEFSSGQRSRHYGDPIHTKNLTMKLCTKPKLKEHAP